MVTITLPGPLHAAAGGAARVTLAGEPGTVAEALEALFRLHPRLRDRIVTERGELRPHVNVFVGRESIRWSGGLATRVPAGAVISVIPAVSGGLS